MARPRGSKNKKISTKRRIAKTVAETLARMNTNGRSMAEIQIDAARYAEHLGEKERDREGGNVRQSLEYFQAAAKIAHDVSPYLYPTLQSIKHGGDEDAPPIRLETLSEHQLEVLIGRLRKG